MQALIIDGMRPLRGCVRVHGSKNGVLPLMAASLLVRGQTVLHRCPALTDVRTTAEILKHLGASCRREGDTLLIDTADAAGTSIPGELMQRQRASVLLAGSLLARCGAAELTAPGGCALGERPIDLHLMLLRQLGAEVTQDGDRIRCRAAELPGGSVHLRYPSVGATENFLLLAQGCSGVSQLSGAAVEPEIGELAAFLSAMGARIDGVGTPTLTVTPAPLHPAEHTVMADRIEAATLLCAAVATGGEVALEDLEPRTLRPVLEVLWQTGCAIRCGDSSIQLKARERPLAPEPVVTAPWPGFPTDVQAPLMAALLRCEGTARIRECVFSSRFHHVPELRRLGARIETENSLAAVYGVERLHGAHLQGCELRGTAALIVAALSAEGQSVVTGLEYLDRGYEDIKNLLFRLDAAIKRVEISEEIVYTI